MDFGGHAFLPRSPCDPRRVQEGLAPRPKDDRGVAQDEPAPRHTRGGQPIFSIQFLNTGCLSRDCIGAAVG